MKKVFRIELIAIGILLIVTSVASCIDKNKASNKEMAMNEEPIITKAIKPKKQLSEEFKKYWYGGKAEITSYKLEQARYGQLRDGHSVLIYVTEPFLPEKQVKADRDNPENVNVLKLNSTKKYLTGIYPYSVMGSTFYPVYDNQHALKTSLSVQEWCGHVYSQINNRENFEFTSHSYFESEADQSISLQKDLLENEIWTKIRINPADLPTGNIKMIPSLEYLRLRHEEIKAQNAIGSLSSQDGMSSYTITYPELERSLTINFTSDFPYAIESWTEEFKSGFGPKAKLLTTRGTKLKSIKTAYWGQNGNDDVVLRDSLGLN
ncbi:septum formation inhibitor Maf [Flagellimonas sp. 2504JD1-5]